MLGSLPRIRCLGRVSVLPLRHHGRQAASPGQHAARALPAGLEASNPVQRLARSHLRGLPEMHVFEQKQPGAPDAVEDYDVPPLVKIGFSNAGIADDASATLTYEGNADYGWKLRSIGGFALRGFCITDPKCLIETGVQRITERGGIKLVQGRGEAARVVASLCIDQRGVQSAYACDLPRSQPTTKYCAANRQHLCVSIKPQVRF